MREKGIGKKQRGNWQGREWNFGEEKGARIRGWRARDEETV